MIFRYILRYYRTDSHIKDILSHIRPNSELMTSFYDITFVLKQSRYAKKIYLFKALIKYISVVSNSKFMTFIYRKLTVAPGMPAAEKGQIFNSGPYGEPP